MDITVSLKNLDDSEIKEYTKILAGSKGQPSGRMTEQAKRIGANAGTCLRFTASGIMGGAAEPLAYGITVIVG